MTIASIYGATIQTDAYYVAEGLMQNVLISISEALAVSFLPVYIGIREKNREDSSRFASRTMTDVFFWLSWYLLVCIFHRRYCFESCFRTYTASESSTGSIVFSDHGVGYVLFMSNQLLQSLLNAEKDYAFFFSGGDDEQC